MSENTATPLVSVILPTYNRVTRLPSAIRSVLYQTYANLELIVVDDASDDDTEELVRSFADDRVHYVRLPQNRGPSAARNVGISKAQGRYLAFQDSDDIWLPTKIEAHLAVAARHDSPVVTYCCLIKLNTHDAQIRPRRNNRPNGDVLSHILNGSFVGTPAIVAETEIVRAVGGFDEDIPYIEDRELMIRLAQRCHFYCVEAPSYLYRFDGGARVIENQIKIVNSRRYILEKHRKIFEQFPKEYRRINFEIGHAFCKMGHTASGRTFLRQAWRIAPHRPRELVALLAAYLLGNRYVLLYRSYKAVLRIADPSGEPPLTGGGAAGRHEQDRAAGNRSA